jgi:hypothetical protein
MDLSLLATLKQKLVEATRFADVFNYFFDHFGEKPEFMKLGEPGSDLLLEAALEQIAEQLFERKVPVTNVMLVRLAEQQFLHGTAMLGDRLATVIYFQEIEMGMLAVLWSHATSETKFIRFRGVAVPTRRTPSIN